MSFKSPTSDDVFNRWLEKAKGGSIKKLYDMDKEKVSAAESVKNVDKSVIFVAEVESTAKKIDEKPIKHPLTFKKASGIVFYKPESAQAYANKKSGKVEVPLFDTLNKVKCKKCDGTGKIVCKVCNGKGHQDCKTCKGSGGLKCKKCNGSGALIHEVAVVDNEGKKRKEQLKQNCPECFGEQKTICTTCGGLGEHRCENCKGVGAHHCDECGGAGTLIVFKQAIFESPKAKEAYATHTEKRYEFLKKNIPELIPTMAGIKFKSSSELTQEKMEPILGYYNELVDKMLKDSKNAFSKIEKEGRMKSEIQMLPLLHLQCEGKKEKKFDIFSLGTEDGFSVLDKGVP